LFSKILIANRGEIAVRIIRTCKEMGIKTVAVYTEVDRDAMHVKLAHEAVCLDHLGSGGGYLNIYNYITSALLTKAEAIHPGYGFLSEKPAFAEMTKVLKLVFIGPRADTIIKMGNKVESLKIARKAGVPIIPGSEGAAKDSLKAKKISKKIGFPIIIKASGGGGGKGMRIVRDEANLLPCFEGAVCEAQAYFNNAEVYIEKYIENARHIEIQILADERGNIICLGERDCSIQRRHQKLVEESPAPSLPDSLREKMCKAAVRLARKVRYAGAGTVEFIVAPDGNFYFIEMNTRIQVEHPVTEMVYGIDIVKEQIRIAAALKLQYIQDNIVQHGHAIECRINAEDPAADFMPSPGKIEELILPGGPYVRVDTHIYTGYTVPHEYDSLMAKLIVQAEDRQTAIIRMIRALEEFKVKGIKTNIPLHLSIMKNELFLQGKYSTSFLETQQLQKEL
jgi:acetyl-CoA carboxylase biotin carboxylase subunit